jgi:hypothetical protein
MQGDQENVDYAKGDYACCIEPPAAAVLIGECLASSHRAHEEWQNNPKCLQYSSSPFLKPFPKRLNKPRNLRYSLPHHSMPSIRNNLDIPKA